MLFCLSFPLLLLKFSLSVMEPQMHTIQGHSGSTHKTRSVVFVGEMLPREKKHFWWHFFFRSSVSVMEIFLSCTLSGTLGHCRMIMQGLLMSSPMVLPTDLHTFTVYVLILMYTTSNKLSVQGMDRSIHQA